MSSATLMLVSDMWCVHVQRLLVGGGGLLRFLYGVVFVCLINVLLDCRYPRVSSLVQRTTYLVIILLKEIIISLSLRVVV